LAANSTDRVHARSLPEPPSPPLPAARGPRARRRPGYRLPRSYKRAPPRSSRRLHHHSQIPLPLELPSAAAHSRHHLSPPPPPIHLCTPSQPKVGRGIDPPCRPLHFTLHPDRCRGPAHRQSPPAGRLRAASPPSLF
jgi:hypothetical protein